MDDQILMALGVSGAIVPLAGGIVKNTIDRLRGGFQWDAKQCIIACYALSYVMVLLLQLAAIKTLPSLTPDGLLSVVGFICAVLVTGLLTGNYAGSLTDTHSKARKDQPPRPTRFTRGDASG